MAAMSRHRTQLGPIDIRRDSRQENTSLNQSLPPGDPQNIPKSVIYPPTKPR